MKKRESREREREREREKETKKKTPFEHPGPRSALPPPISPLTSENQFPVRPSSIIHGAVIQQNPTANTIHARRELDFLQRLGL